jgi:Spy/CpxP family protein refolding chaperone
MNTQLRKSSWIIAVISVLFFTSIAFAQQSGQGWGRRTEGGQGRFGNIVKELKLSPEQQQQIVEQRKKEREQAQQIREKLKATRDELSRQLDKENPDKAKVYSLVSEMKELIGKRIEQKVDRILSLREILTPEQFRKLNERTKRFEWQKGRKP